MLPRKTVAGWNSDYIKTYQNYFDAHNALMSRVKYAYEIASATNDMIKYTKDHELDGTPGGFERSSVLTELNNRENFFGSPDYTGSDTSEFGKFMAPVLRKAAALSFLQHMVSVGHIISHSTHQILTADMVAAKYGGFGTMGEGARLHAMLAGAGFKNAWQSFAAAKDIIMRDMKGLNYVESLIDKLEKNHRYGTELRAMINRAIETDRIHPDQGFDSSVYHMDASRTDRALAKLDLASRQLLQSNEAYNRVWG